MVWSHPQVEQITTLEFFPLWTEKNSNHPQVSPCTDTVIQLLISFHQNQMLPFKWCKSNKNPTLLLLISVVWMSKNNKWEKLLNSHLLILNFILKLVLILQKVSSCMDLLVQEKLWWPKPLLITQLQLSLELLVHNLYKNIWVKVQGWSEMSLNWPNKINLQSYSSIKSIPLLQNVSMPKQVLTDKFKESWSSYSIKWMVSNKMLTSKSSCQQTELILWILPYFVQEDLIEK